MRLSLSALSLFLLVGGCDNTNSVPPPAADLSMSSSPDLTQNMGGGDMASNALATVTVNNTISWCNVTVTVGNASPVMFGTSSMDFMAAPGTTVTLNATPKPTFLPVVWTGTTTMNGANATYVMTAAAGQMVTACCPLPNGSGC